MNIHSIVFAIGIITTFFSSSLYPQIEVQISVTKDNTLYENETGSSSNGAGEHFFAGKTNSGFIRRALLAFDIAGNIPEGATIDSVTLKLTMSRTQAGPETVSLHRILADWGEGTSDAPGEEGNGADSTPDDATWIHTFFDTSFWTNVGGDFLDTISGSQTVEDTGLYTWGSTEQMVEIVQAWLDSPSENFGWILVGNEAADKTAKRFDSRENSVETNRPALVVSYTMPISVHDEKEALALEFNLSQNYPNPFNPTTRIEFSLPTSGLVTLTVYDILARKVETILNQHMDAGTHNLQWDASNVPTGIYFVRMVSGDFSQTRKMLLLK